MHDDEQYHKQIASEIQDGSYFTNMRAWYDSVYLQPLVGRIYAIIISIISITIFGFAYFAVQNLLPLTDEVPYVYMNAKGDGYAPKLTRLRQPGDNINSVVERLLLSKYVEMREGYAEKDFVKNQRFILRYSQGTAQEGYKRLMSRSNPRNPLVRYQNKFTRFIDIISIDYQGSGDIKTANIVFRATLADGENQETRTWRAQVQYTFLKWNDAGSNLIDQETGDIKIEMADTDFKVVQYDAFDITG